MTSGSIGPALPPDLVEARRRKRQAASLREQKSVSEHANNDEVSRSAIDVDSQLSDGRPLPAADAASEKAQVESKDSDEDDDTVGPQLPSATEEDSSSTGAVAAAAAQSKASELDAATGRPAWMLAPPTTGELARNYNPLKSRGFAPKSRNAGAEDKIAHKWISTPGQADNSESSASTGVSAQNASRQAHNERQHEIARQADMRGPSLYDQHSHKRRRTGSDPDDPSKRPFDREKDIGSNMSLKRTKDFVDRSKDMQSMFVTGSYL